MNIKTSKFTEEDSDVVLTATNETINVTQFIEELLQQGDFYTWDAAKEEINHLYKASRDLCEMFETAQDEFTQED